MTTTQSLPATNAQTGDVRHDVAIARVVSDRKNIVITYVNGGRECMSLSQARLTTVTRTS